MERTTVPARKPDSPDRMERMALDAIAKAMQGRGAPSRATAAIRFAQARIAIVRAEENMRRAEWRFRNAFNIESSDA